MSFGVAPKMTQLGQRALMKSFNGVPLDFPNGKFLIGSGFQPGLSAWSMTGLLQPVAEIPITSVVRQQINPGTGESPEDGLSFVRLRGIIPVGLLPDNFLVGELGLQVPSNLAEPGEVTAPILFGYTDADDPEVYHMRGSSLNAEVIDVFILISDDAAVNLTPDLGMVAATLFDIDEAVDAHNKAPGRHAAQFADVNNRITTHMQQTLAHGLHALLRPDGTPIQGNVHGVKLFDLFYRGVNCGTWEASPRVGGTYVIIGPFVFMHGYVKGLSTFISGTPSREVPFPQGIEFQNTRAQGSGHAEPEFYTYYAEAHSLSGMQPVGIEKKYKNKMVVKLWGVHNDIDAEWSAFGMLKTAASLPEAPSDVPAPELPLQALPTPDGNVYARFIVEDGTICGNFYTESGRLLAQRNLLSRDIADARKYITREGAA